MSVDELDVGRVKVGQTVNVTADAIEGKTFTGKVTNISLQSSQSNGVTNYPVTVTLDEVGDLLPGMNVDGTIILDQVDDALMIPVDSLMRGNRVYVKDDSVTGQQGNVPADLRQWTWRQESAMMITCRSQAVFPRVMRSMWIPRPAIPAPICSRWAAWAVLTAAWEAALAEEMADRRKRRQPWRWKWRKPRWRRNAVKESIDGRTFDRIKRHLQNISYGR